MIYVACSRAVHGVGTLWLLAGMEQAGARSGGNTRHNSGSFGRQGGQGSGAGRRVCRTSAENPGYKVTFAGANGQHNSCLRRDEHAARRAIYGTEWYTFSIGKPLAYLLKGRMAGKGVTSLLTHRRRMQPNATGMQTKKAGRLTRPFIMLTAWRLLSNREANIVGGCVGEGLRAVLITLRGANV